MSACHCQCVREKESESEKEIEIETDRERLGERERDSRVVVYKFGQFEYRCGMHCSAAMLLLLLLLSALSVLQCPTMTRSH